MKFRAFFLSILFLFGSEIVLPDEVNFENGDRISGSLQNIAGKTIAVKTEYAGVIFVDKSKVVSIVTDSPFVLIDKDGNETVQAIDESIDIETLVVVRSTNQLIARLTSAWNHQVTLAVAGTSGNSDTQNYSVVGETLRIRPKNEHQLRFSYLREIAANVTRKDALDLKYQIRWFRQNNWFNTANLDYFRDPLKDVIWRAVIGLGGGTKLIDASNQSLAVEAAASGVYESLEDFEDVTPAIRLGGDYKRILVGGRIEAFMNNRFLWLTQSNKGVLDSEGGFRVSLTSQFNFDMRASLQHETKPPAGAEGTDLTFSVGMGIKF